MRECPEDLAQQQLLEYAKDLKKTYDELGRKVKELEILNKKKTDFLDMVAHELKTPVTIIVEVADFLLTGGIDRKDRKEVLEMFRRQTARLGTTMSEIILANQQNQKEVSCKLEDLKLDDLIKELGEEITPYLRLRNQNLRTSIEDRNVFIKGNKLRLFDGLFSIVQNASRFSEDGKEIFIRLKKQDDKVTIEVEDQGIGIAEDKLDLIFNPFYEDEDIMHHHSGAFEFKSSGLGMGLYMARSIAEKHGGNITAESTPGKGSKFSVILPLVERQTYSGSGTTPSTETFGCSRARPRARQKGSNR